MLLATFTACFGCYFASNAIHLQAAHDKIIYIVTEGRFTYHVDLNYELPNNFLGCCSSRQQFKGFYLDIDEVNVSAYPQGIKPACEPCKCIMNPDDIPHIFIGGSYNYAFPVASHEERDELIKLIHEIKSRRDNSIIRGGVSNTSTSKRVFIAPSFDPTNFSLMNIESDDWELFMKLLKVKYPDLTITSVKLADVNIQVTKVAEISANDKLIIS